MPSEREARISGLRGQVEQLTREIHELQRRGMEVGMGLVSTSPIERAQAEQLDTLIRSEVNRRLRERAQLEAEIGRATGPALRTGPTTVSFSEGHSSTWMERALRETMARELDHELTPAERAMLMTPRQEPRTMTEIQMRVANEDPETAAYRAYNLGEVTHPTANVEVIRERVMGDLRAGRASLPPRVQQVITQQARGETPTPNAGLPWNADQMRALRVQCDWCNNAKDLWETGAWKREPDRVRWISARTEYPCVARRQADGRWRSWVLLPAGHTLWGAERDWTSPDGRTWEDLLLALCFPRPLNDWCREQAAGLEPHSGLPSDEARWAIGLQPYREWEIPPCSYNVRRDHGTDAGYYTTLADTVDLTEELAQKLQQIHEDEVARVKMSITPARRSRALEFTPDDLAPGAPPVRARRKLL